MSQIDYSAWKAVENGRLVTLPDSGMTVRIRGISPQTLIESGTIPNKLLQTALNMFNGATDVEIDEDELEEITSQAEKIQQIVVLDAITEPTFYVGEKENPSESEVKYTALSDYDSRFVYNLCLRPLRDWENFRQQYEKSMESLYPSQDIQNAPVSDNEHTGVGE